MKLLILNNKRSTDYTIYFEKLLYTFLKTNGYFVKTNTGTDPSGSELISDENEIVTKAMPAGIFSLLTRFSIQLFIKRQTIKWLSVFAYRQIFSSSLPQIIIPVDAGQLIIKKPLHESAVIIVGSVFQKEKLLTLYPFLTKNVHLVPFSPIKPVAPVSWSEKQAFKFGHTQGREFFLADLFNASAVQFMNLLKAFSTFKKWQLSNMKLVINKMFQQGKSSEILDMLSTYRFRDDVILTKDAFAGNEYIAYLSSAYAFLHLPSSEEDVVPLLDAMRCETPCVSFSTDIIKEYCNEVVLLVEPGDYDELSQQMILLYKDENLRDRLIATGKERAQVYSKEKAMHALAEALPANVH